MATYCWTQKSNSYTLKQLSIAREECYLATLFTSAIISWNNVFRCPKLIILALSKYHRNFAFLCLISNAPYFSLLAPMNKQKSAKKERERIDRWKLWSGLCPDDKWKLVARSWVSDARARDRTHHQISRGCMVFYKRHVHWGTNPQIRGDALI